MDFDKEYHDLINLLREKGVGWLADQVETDIAIGKFTESKRYIQNIRLELTKNNRRHSPGPTALFTVREEYSPQEKFELLLRAVRRALVEPALMEQKSLINFGDSVTTISFQSTTETTDTTLSRTFGRAEANARVANAQMLDEEILKLIGGITT